MIPLPTSFEEAKASQWWLRMLGFGRGLPLLCLACHRLYCLQNPYSPNSASSSASCPVLIRFLPLHPPLAPYVFAVPCGNSHLSNAGVRLTNSLLTA